MAQEAQPTLAGDFPPASEQDWLDAVDTALRGAPFSKLVSSTADDIAIQPLYVEGPDESTTGTPGAAPFTRGFSAESRDGTWDVRVDVSHSDPVEVNRLALRELERGATSLILRGAQFADADFLGRSLAGVHMDLARVVLQPLGPFADGAAALVDLWQRSGVADEAALANLGADPFGHLATTGTLWAAPEGALADLGRFAADTASRFPLVRAVTVDATSYAEAGASEGQELAAMLCTATAYLRAMQEAGMSANEAGRSIAVVIGADTDFFTTMAKVRAARRLWSTMASACGVDCAVAPPEITVRTLDRMMTRRDPWVNLLRGTSASFGAVLGGADAVVTSPFDVAWGDPVELSRRMARNTQLLIGEESGGGRVTDPAGGSWYIETLTEELARTGWETFRVLEGAGGMPGVVLDGTLQAHIAGVRDARLADVAKRKQPITGVSEFPDIHEAPLVGRSHTPLPSSDYEVVATAQALVPVRWAERYEALRDSADAMAQRPQVFLANLGPVAVHTARASFSKNFFEAGGIEAVTSDTGSRSGFSDPETLAGDFTASPARVAVICSSDETYASDATAAATALKSAGAELVYLAGRPGDLADEWAAAGVDGYVGVGVDVLKILEEVHERIGVQS